MAMRRAFIVLCILFMLLTFAGTAYVIVSGGEASPGCAVVPMLFTLIFLGAYRSCKGRVERK